MIKILYFTISAFIIFIISCTRGDNKSLHASKDNQQVSSEKINDKSINKDDDVFICMIMGDTIILVDENIDFSDKPDLYESKLCEKILEKYGGKNTTDMFFRKYVTDFSELTRFRDGDLLFLSTGNGVLKTTVRGFRIYEYTPSGLEFNPVLDKPISVVHNADNEDMNILICSKNPGLKSIRHDLIVNDKLNETVSQIFKASEKFYSKEENKIFSPPETKIFKGNFLKSGYSEYLISYFHRLTHNAYSGGVFVTDENGNILEKVFDITLSGFYYSRVVGIVDVNGDGIDELLTENGYFDGNRYELWKCTPGLSKITTGFDWGL